MNLQGKRALVTGGSRGIGAAIAKALAEEGADVVITYERSSERAAEVVELIKQKGQRGVALQADCADPSAIKQAIGDTVKALGGLDILINSAGIGRLGNVEDISLDDVQAMLNINVRAPLLFAQAAIPHMKEGGRIISIGSSLAERVPFAGATTYSMTKSALLGFTRGLSRELGPRGITVNLVMPGSINTELNPADGEGADLQRSLTSLGRYGEPHEIGAVVAFLASPAADLVTGAMLVADGGFSA
ncbi:MULTISPECIES: SDR family NAD(P)-dependent oxidoreductase [Pseudomonas fluorescens group]